MCGNYPWRDDEDVCATYARTFHHPNQEVLTMTDSLPRLDREKLRRRLLQEFEQVVDKVADAVDDAPQDM